MEINDVVVLGAGPAGLAAGLSAAAAGAQTMVIERENKPGGVLKQCIHDGFGLIEFGERLTGPEYAGRYIKMVREANVPMYVSTFVTRVEKNDGLFKISMVSRDGVREIGTKAIVLANGCRERTARQVFIHGTRPAGVYTAGTAQHLVNVDGYLPCRKCVVLGSGDIGLIMARRLTLEGAEVIGVYEAKSEPSGLERNIAQCLNDYNIPLHLSMTVTRIIGDDRVEAVEVSRVDENMNPIGGSEEVIECDGVILSVGLIPENEIAESLGVQIDSGTKGPYVDQDFMTMVNGVFSCGNALHVNDLVDYVTESGRIAGQRAALYSKFRWSRKFIPVKIPDSLMYAVPQYINMESQNKKLILYFRSRRTIRDGYISMKLSGSLLFERKYPVLKPPEMQRIEVNLDNIKSMGEYFSLDLREGIE